MAADCKLEMIRTANEEDISFLAIQFVEHQEVRRYLKEEDHQILLQLEKLMAKKQLFLDTQLQQIDVANALNTSKRKLGEILKNELSTTFPSYINAHRVKYAQIKLQETNNPYTLEEIGKQSGFSSKTSFYTIFKDLTTQTPGQYRKKHLQ